MNDVAFSTAAYIAKNQKFRDRAYLTDWGFCDVGGVAAHFEAVIPEAATRVAVTRSIPPLFAVPDVCGRQVGSATRIERLGLIDCRTRYAFPVQDRPLEKTSGCRHLIRAR